MNNFLFKIDFNPNDFPQIENLENFYIDAFFKSYKLSEQKLLGIFSGQSIDLLKNYQPNTGFLYAKKENNQNSKSVQKGGLESVIKKLNLQVWNSESVKGKVINYSKVKFLIGVKPDSDLYVRVVSLQKEYQCGKQELCNYYLVHFYKYKHDIQRANIQLISACLKENQSNQNKMEEEIQQPQVSQVKQEYYENQEETENKRLKRQVEQLQIQVKALQEYQLQQQNLIGQLVEKFYTIECQFLEIKKSQNTIILD
ncbi:hypothetical protein ABPG74_013577 [Tetrahymena malaccensis]